ncbi:MAG: ABC transporter permease, partial [Bryobacteraceae bacterium]
MVWFHKSADRLYRRLLNLYPEDFRAEYGEEMATLFDDRRRSEPLVPLLFDTFVDAAKTAPKEHFSMLWQDVRFAVRTMSKNPGFVAVAMLSLALGVGANTAMFSFTDALLLRPAPVPEPDRLLRMFTNSAAKSLAGVSYPDYLDIRDQMKTISGTAASKLFPASLGTTGDAPARIKLGLAVNPEYFDTLQVRAELGRTFRKEEDRQEVVVLSHAAWVNEFASDPGIVGRVVRINSVDFTVIGVLPETFLGLNRVIHEDFYAPAGVLVRLAQDPTALERRDRRSFDLYARLAPGRSAAEARDELKSLSVGLAQTYPATNLNRTLIAMPEHDAILAVEKDESTLVILLLSLSGLVLLIACANVANLLLSRARGRSREVAIRLAVGAGRGRLIRQLLTESMVLGLVGGAAGVAAGFAAIRFLGAIRLPSDLPVSIATRLDGRALFVSIGVALLAALLFGVFPAFRTARTDLTEALKAGDSAGMGRNRRFHMRNVLVVGQVAVSMALLLLSGLLVRDLSETVRFNPGFRTDHVLLLTMDPALTRYDETRGRSFYKQLLENVRVLPGVRSAVLGMHVPLGFTSSTVSVVVDGYQLPKNQDSVVIDTNTVTEGYFETMQIPIMAGRAFDRRDTPQSPMVAMVNQAMAARLGVAHAIEIIR